MELESRSMFRSIAKCSKRMLIVGSLSVLLASLSVTISCGDDEGENEHVVLPTATPGAIPPTPTAVVVQSDATGALQVGFHFGIQGQPQQGAGVLSQVGRGTKIEVNVRPAPGAVQQVSIREGRCESVGKWIDSVDPAIGGVSRSELKEIHIRDLVDGNHLIALSYPGGTFSEMATCANLPDLTHIELREEVP